MSASTIYLRSRYLYLHWLSNTGILQNTCKQLFVAYRQTHSKDIDNFNVHTYTKVKRPIIILEYSVVAVCWLQSVQLVMGKFFFIAINTDMTCTIDQYLGFTCIVALP